MRKFAAFLPAVMIFSASLTGCSGHIHDKSYLQAVSVVGKEKTTLTLSFYGEDSVVIGIGDDTDSAKHDAELKLGKEIFTGYTELVIIDDVENAEKLEYFLNEWKVPPSCITASGSSELLQNVSADKLIGSVKQAKKQGTAPECDIITVLSKLLHSESAETAKLSEEGFEGVKKISSDVLQLRTRHQGDSKDRHN